MPVDFLGREIEVRLSDDEPTAPLSFRIGRSEHKVAEQLATWQDQGFAALQRGRDRPPQQQRRYYRVRTEGGEVYEIYAEWSPARRRKGKQDPARWFVRRRLRTAAPEEPAEPEPESPSAGRPRPSARARPPRDA